MTYEERIAQFCENECVSREGCVHVLCGNTHRCDYLVGIMHGWELGQRDTLEEIEKYANMQDGCYALECIQMRIQELKGEIGDK